MELFTKKKDALEVIQGKYEAFEKAKAEAQVALDAAQAKVAEANTALEAAADANDAAAFERAKALLVKAETGVEMAQMRLDKIVANGPVTKAEIELAIKEYETKVQEINANACREIIDRLTALNEVIDFADQEARALLIKEKALCDLCGIEFHPIHGQIVAGGCIYASQMRTKWPSTARLRSYPELQSFAAKV